jgi:phosphonate transport system substrate-binding protein
VRADSPITEVSQLARARAAWVDPASSSGFIFPRMHLVAAGVAGERALTSEKFCGSAANACRAVANREADLCACFLSVATDRAQAQAEIEKTFGATAGQLRVVGVTAPIPPDGLVLAAELDRGFQSALTRLLLSLHLQTSGRKALRTLLQADRLVAPTDAVLREVARLRTSAVS